MKINNKESPRGSSIVTSHSEDSGVPKDGSEGFFSFTFLKCVDLLILYEKLSTTPAKEIKRLVLEEIKKELGKLKAKKKEKK